MRRLPVIGLACALAGLVSLPATASAQNTITGDVADGSPAGRRTIRPDNAWKNWYRNVDLRISRSLFTAQATKVSLSAEVFNAFNTNNTANYAGRQLDAAGNPLANFGLANTAFGARRAQVGMRADF